MRCPHQRHVPTEGPSCSYTARPKFSSAAAPIRSLRSPAARFETKLVWSAAQPKTVRVVKVPLPAFRLFTILSLLLGLESPRKGLLSCAKQSQLVQVLMHPSLQHKRRQPVLPHCSGHERASTTLDPDDYELFEESYDPDDYEPLDVRFSTRSLRHDTMSCQGTLPSLLRPEGKNFPAPICRRHQQKHLRVEQQPQRRGAGDRHVFLNSAAGSICRPACALVLVWTIISVCKPACALCCVWVIVFSSEPA